jgi:predicted ATPase
MRLKSVFVRFYKSFNYDYLRKIKADHVDQKPWEFLNGQFYPYVEVPIDQKITTIVGANESGKSHLLTAIEKGLTGKSEHSKSGSEITRKDFCRYSHFFKSTVGEPQLPDFGFEWVDVEDSLKQLQKICKMPTDRKFDRFFLFRCDQKKLILFVPKVDGEGFDQFSISSLPEKLFPHIFRIDSNVALPDSIPIARLIEGRYPDGALWQPSGRELAFLAADAVPKLRKYFQNICSLNRIQSTTGASDFSLPDKLHKEAEILEKQLNDPSMPWREDELRRKALEFNLAYDLIFEIAKISVADIKMLDDALRKGESGIVRAVVNNINEALRKRLNFPRIWAQDRSFALRIETTEHELSFIISDRTGREYSFDERSSGLRHFLSYYIQYLTHKPQGSSEILLMDEPDAFLSGEAQQDLLKVFQMFADPTVGRGVEAVPVQVIYVTHSPFLIDKNHAERVRALEKAEGSKGTRVISGAAQNHYEPLRSAFGSFVGETTFISGCNLMVEGPADQILLAGSAAYLRKLETVPESQLLDLNRITIVPCGGAQNVPYLVYLARGRDAEKPAVIVLLDSDTDGDTAKKNLSKNGPHPQNKQVLDPKFILQLGDIPITEIEKIKDKLESLSEEISGEQHPFNALEDLVPLPLALRATRKFIQSVYVLPDTEIESLSEDAVCSAQKPGESAFVAIQSVLYEMDSERTVHMDKVPFARTIVDLLPELAREREDSFESGDRIGLNQFEANMRAVFHRLWKMQMLAEQDLKDKRMRQKVEEKIQTFLNDHLSSGTAFRDDASRLLFDIESDLEGDDTERTFILQTCTQLRTTHDLIEDLFEPVREFSGFADGLEILRNASDYAYSNPNVSVPSQKKSKSQQESAGGKTAKPKKTQPSESELSDSTLSSAPTQEAELVTDTTTDPSNTTQISTSASQTPRHKSASSIEQDDQD